MRESEPFFSMPSRNSQQYQQSPAWLAGRAPEWWQLYYQRQLSRGSAIHVGHHMDTFFILRILHEEHAPAAEAANSKTPPSHSHSSSTWTYMMVTRVRYSAQLSSSAGSGHQMTTGKAAAVTRKDWKPLIY
jgi:hypothetical protein